MTFPTCRRVMNKYKVVLKDEDLFIEAPDCEAAAAAALQLSIHLEQDLFDVIPMKDKKEFPNEWKKWKSLPAEQYVPIEYGLMMKLRVENWALDSSTYCIFRFTNIHTGKVKEKAYKSKKYALEALTRAVIEGDHEIVMVQDESCDYYNPLEMEVNFDELF